MDQDNLDNTNWVVQLAELASGSEPKTDHTYGTGEGEFLDLSWKQYTSRRARLAYWLAHLPADPVVLFSNPVPIKG